jgi:hypothetical protein
MVIGNQMISEETIKEMYKAKSESNVDSYIEANGRGYINFKTNVEFISQYLANNVGWTPSAKVNHKTEGETVLYKLEGDSITLKDDGIHITWDDGHWKWFSFSSFMKHLKMYRTLKLKLDKMFGFYKDNIDEW